MVSAHVRLLSADLARVRSFRGKNVTNHRQIVAVLGVAVSCAVLAGCGGSNSKSNPGLNQAPPTTSSSASSATTPVDAAAQEKSAALDAYKGMVAVTVREFATNLPDADLMTYVSGNAYVFFSNYLTYQITNNLVYRGTPQSSPTITSINPSSAPPSATITDCFGGPNFNPVFWKTKDGHKQGDSAAVPGTSVAPHPVTAILEKVGGHWLVINYTLGSTTC
jgi:hypothetical protein